MGQSNIFQIEMISGKIISLQYLTDEQTSEILHEGNWSKIPSSFDRFNAYRNQEGKILQTGYDGNKSVMFDNQLDYNLFYDAPCRIILLQSENSNRLMYFELVTQEEKENMLKQVKFRKNKDLSKKKDYEILELDNGKVMLSLINDSGELYNSIADYIEIRKMEGDPFWGVAIPIK